MVQAFVDELDRANGNAEHLGDDRAGGHVGPRPEANYRLEVLDASGTSRLATRESAPERHAELDTVLAQAALPPTFTASSSVRWMRCTSSSAGPRRSCAR